MMHGFAPLAITTTTPSNRNITGRRSFMRMNLFKNLKKSLVKGLAGDYDEEAISKQLNEYAE